MKRFVLLLAGMLVLTAQPALADLRVLACEPEWGALTQELGGDNVEVYSATTAFQDPHHIEARPSLIAQTRLANLLVCSGAQLEIGWLPLLLRSSGNGDIQPGEPGYVETSSLIQRLEIPSRVDRSMGDIHPGGNPHVQLDPRRVLKIAAVLSERMQQLDPDLAAQYRARCKDFKARWTKAIARWEAEAKPLKGVPVVVHHKNFTYLFNWLGIKEVGELEPKPGIPPTAAHLAELIAQLQAQPAKMVIRAAYESDQASQFLSERTGIPDVMLPYTIGGTPAANDLFGLFDDTINRLLGGLKQSSR
ncbi:MAG TPA: zinc ABC transporter substrate-binding protein [Gammaproteobacteria bacterium]|nr:zinc ABC transporter substrate-binding protein [Gammaproteobacteria bacterium]